MPTIACRFSLLVLILFSGATLVFAQATQQQGQPQHSQTSGIEQQGNSNGTLPSQQSAQQTDTTGQQATNTTTTTRVSSSAQPLTGAEEFTLTRLGAAHSYFFPSFQYGQSVNSSGTSTFPTSNIDSISTISAVFALHHLWSRYDFKAQYSGIGLLYNTHPASNTSAHNFVISQRIDGKRSSLLLEDVATYMPESRYGYARFGGGNTFSGSPFGYGGLYTGSTGGLDTTFLPGQSILTGASSQVGNSVVAEYQYLTSPESRITMTGSYVSLFFPGSQYITNNNIIARIGYDHSLSPRNSLGLFYQGGIFHFGSLGGNFTSHAAILSYRHTISHRFAFELGAGPQINIFNNSVAHQDTQLSWQTQALLTYQLERLSLGLDYYHYTNGGSGIYRGARTDTVVFRTSIPFSRRWAVGVSGGYAYNTSVQAGTLTGAALSYNSWYGTINIHHTLNRWMSLFVSYNLRQQMTSQTTCIGPTCGTFYAQQYMTVGIDWHPGAIGTE